MRVFHLQVPWCTSFGVFLDRLEFLYQPRRLPQITLSGLPDSAGRQLRSKLDVLAFEFLGSLKGRYHIHVSNFRPGATVEDAELPCLLGLKTVQTSHDRKGAVPPGLASVGTLDLNGQTNLSRATARLLRENLTGRGLETLTWVLPQNVGFPREHLLSEIATAQLGELLKKLSEKKLALVPSHAEPAASETSSELWSTLDPTEKVLLMLIATGWHTAFLIGPPGSGKSYLAEIFWSLLCDLSQADDGAMTLPRLCRPPTASTPEHLVFGYRAGSRGRIAPSQWDEASQGVLWLDELPEFRRSSLEALRVPLDGAGINEPRLFVATANPCPCGYFRHPTHLCACRPRDRSQYFAKLSGPLLDRLSIGYSTLLPRFSTQLQAPPTYAELCIRVREAWRWLAAELQSPCGAQWTPSSVIVRLFQKKSGLGLDSFPVAGASRRRVLQIMRRSLSIQSLMPELGWEAALEEAIPWDCQRVCHDIWETTPALFVSAAANSLNPSAPLAP